MPPRFKGHSLARSQPSVVLKELEGRYLNHDIGSIAQVKFVWSLLSSLLKGNNTFTSFHGNNEQLRERTSKRLLWFLVDRIFYCVNRMEKLRFKVA